MTESQHHLLDNYSDLFDYIYRYIHIRVEDKDIAHDLVSEVFIKALEHSDTFDASKGNLKQWLTGITKYHLFSYWKQYKTTVSLDDVELGALPDYRLLDFNQLLERLPSAAQQLLRWRYVDDFTYEEIAKLTKKKPPAVRQYFSRLHIQLKSYLENNYDLT